MKVVIDTDPGTDDALALIMALNAPELEVLGLTTVGGNHSQANTTRNALALLERLGADVPVSRGAARPMQDRFRYAPHYHGPGGLTVRLPRPQTRPMPLRAADYIAYMAWSHPGELVIIALGPLTNVAAAIRKDTRVAGWLKEIFVMGGALEVAGNVTPHAEFNTYNDAHAANVVFSSGAPVTLVGLDVCREPHLSRADVAETPGQSEGERLAFAIVKGWFDMREGSDKYDLCDPLTVAAAIQPDLMSYEQAAVSVETDDAERLGKTTAHYGAGNVRVARAVKSDAATASVKGLLRGR